MKKLLFVAFLLTSGAAMAQTAPAPSTTPATGVPSAQHEEKFEERKARILDHISKHLAEIQKRQACVQAATTPKALKACLPERKHEHGDGDRDHDDWGAKKQ